MLRKRLSSCKPAYPPERMSTQWVRSAVHERRSRHENSLPLFSHHSNQRNRYRVPPTCTVHAIAPAVIYAPTWQRSPLYDMFGETCPTQKPQRRPDMHKMALAGRRTAGCSVALFPVLSSLPSVGLSLQLSLHYVP